MKIEEISRKKSLVLAMLVLISLIIVFVATFSFSVTAPSEYTLSGDTVYRDVSGKGRISQTPHTLTDFTNEPIVEFTSYYDTEQCFDFAFGFDTDKAKPVSVELYKPEYINHEKSYTCDCENCRYEFYSEPQQRFECWKTFITQNCDNLTGECTNSSDETAIFSHNYETYDAETKTIYWTEQEYREWIDVSDKFGVLKHDAFGKDTWYYVTGVTFAARETKKIKPQIDIKPMLGENSGKYSILVKRCSDTIADAISSGRYVHLDPWWTGGNYTYRMLINCSNIGDKVPLVINGSSGFSYLQGECGKQIIWTYCSGINTSLYYNNCTDYVVANDSTQLPMEVELGNRTNYQVPTLWDSITSGDLNEAIWHFSEGTGTQANSSEGNSNNLSILGTASISTTSAAIGYGLKLTGDVSFTPSHTNCAKGHNTVAGYKNLTMMAFYYTNYTSWSYHLSLIHEGNGDVEDACVTGLGTWGSTGNNTFRISDTSGNTYAYGSSILNNKMNLLVGVWNGSHMFTYLNGQLNNTVTTTRNTIGFDSTYKVSVGLYYRTDSSTESQYNWNGTVDEIRILNYTMTMQEINVTYQNYLGTAGFGTLEPEETKSSEGSNSSGTSLGGTIRTTSGNITLEPAGGFLIINGTTIKMKTTGGNWGCCGLNDSYAWVCSAC